MGLAVAVDYSLFMITRFRTERQRGATVPDAIETSSSTAGRAVFFSGIAVVISLGGLVTLGISLFTSMAVGTMAVVARLGHRQPDVPAGDARDRRRSGEPRAGRSPGSRDCSGFEGRRPWTRSIGGPRVRRERVLGALVNAVMSRPVLLTVLSAALLLAPRHPSAAAHRHDRDHGPAVIDRRDRRRSSSSTRSSRSARTSASTSSSPNPERRRHRRRDRSAQDAGRGARHGMRGRRTCPQSGDAARSSLHDDRRPQRRGQSDDRARGPE